ncbi:MAG: hypothetical protein Q9195_006540 [Heterodermia aff. obscurata]
MRFGITAHGLLPTPSSLQQRPPLKQRAMTAPPTSLPTRGALDSRGASLDSESIIAGESEAYSQSGSSAARLQEPRNSETGEEQAQSQAQRVSRTRSVQFSSPPARMATRSGEVRGGEGEERDGRYAAAESSGDEITPIVSRERGSAKGYDATTTSNTKPGTDAGVSSQDGTAGKSIQKRRRSIKGKRSNSRTADREDEEEGGWWARAIENFGGIELDNKGSVARDHLALERTFLAWLRTSLAFASIGIAITQLFRLNTTISERSGLKPNNPPNTYHLRQLGKPLGATFLGIAILVLAVGGRRYFDSQYWIIRGKFPASRGSIFLITFVALSLIITSLVVVMTVDPTVFERR